VYPLLNSTGIAAPKETSKSLVCPGDALSECRRTHVGMRRSAKDGLDGIGCVTVERIDGQLEGAFELLMHELGLRIVKKLSR
jgi:hypothetical protein